MTKSIIKVTYWGDEEPNVEVPSGLDVDVQLISGDEVNQHVFTYKDVSVFQCVKDFDQLSENWYALQANCAWDNTEAFDVRDLEEPPEGWRPQEWSVIHPSSGELVQGGFVSMDTAQTWLKQNLAELEPSNIDEYVIEQISLDEDELLNLAWAIEQGKLTE